jgi:hypothetical protein
MNLLNTRPMKVALHYYKNYLEQYIYRTINFENLKNVKNIETMNLLNTRLMKVALH